MKYCEYVNIKQGSDSTHRFSNGNTLPLCQLPFGMTAFAPQTAQNEFRWYYQPKSRSFDGKVYVHRQNGNRQNGRLVSDFETIAIYRNGEKDLETMRILGVV